MRAAMQMLPLFAHEVEQSNVSLNSTLLGIVVLMLTASVAFAFRVTNKQTAIDNRLSTIVEEHERRITRLEDLE